MKKSLCILLVVLLIPIVPFAIWHEPLEAWIRARLAQPMSATAVASWIVGLLATDILLPIPSSFLSTLGGSRLPPAIAIGASWLGLTLGSVIGFAASRICGRAWAMRSVGDKQASYLEEFGESHAAWLLVTTRPLPVLAEATVLWLGAQRLSWRSFLPPVLLANLGIAIAYSSLGHFAAAHAWLPLALSVSIALPVLISWKVQRRKART
ncbi:MAG: TVP38/TMEM64 family protein [Planctomycetales bacterium]|nr:TVP38/TMEM64 family protein [Planctomycetales bacterium]